MKKLFTALTTAALFAIIGSSAAQASIIYNFTQVTQVGSNFDWQYVAQLSADQQLLSTANDFAVVYDFPGVVSVSTSNVVAGLTLTNFIENVTTPQPMNQSVPDSATLKNVRTQIAGTFMPGALTNIYTIDIVSTLGTRGGLTFQSAQAMKFVNGDPSNATVAGNTVQVEAPGSATPEPLTITMIGSGLIALGFIRRRRAA